MILCVYTLPNGLLQYTLTVTYIYIVYNEMYMNTYALPTTL